MLVSINNGSSPSGFRNLTASQGARAQFSMRIHSDTHPIHAAVIVILAMILTYLYLVMKRRLAYPLDYPLDFRIRIVHEAAAVEPPPDAQQRDRTHSRNEDGARASSSGPHRRALASLDGSGDISTTSRRPDSDTLSRPAIPPPGPCNNGKFGGLGKSSLVSSDMGCEEKQSMTLLTVEIPVADLVHEFEEWQQ
ncbi:hypothetical protein FOMPIDRAFT_1045854 [Fomitopsis schrenkii]|uniref:Uncharacterized protein n=1 Tax=Fomitopsis schrenkii TaxID=2126942 RepID=S8EHD5_FOMSC|nr:hypothetical protein FOMPIDRAFT_1045854 [Fomitopsis schrenkii]